MAGGPSRCSTGCTYEGPVLFCICPLLERSAFLNVCTIVPKPSVKQVTPRVDGSLPCPCMSSEHRMGRGLVGTPQSAGCPQGVARAGVSQSPCSTAHSLALQGPQNLPEAWAPRQETSLSTGRGLRVPGRCGRPVTAHASHVPRKEERGEGTGKALHTPQRATASTHSPHTAPATAKQPPARQE